MSSFLKTNDVESLTTILQQVAAGIQWKASNYEVADKGQEDDEVPEYREIIGQIVNDVATQLKTNTGCSVIVEKILTVRDHDRF